MSLEDIQKRIEKLDKVRKEFQKELGALLLKYQATISYDYSVDSCSGALMTNELEVIGCPKEMGEAITLLIVQGTEITLNDLEVSLKEVKEQSKEDFRRRLRELLEEYNATIEYRCHPGSDTSNVWDQRMVIEARVGDSFKYENLVEVSWCEIRAKDLQ